jgi:translation initiation factor 5B
LDYLKSQKIPVSHISVGPVSKEDVMKAMKAIISENSDRRCE